MTNEKSLHEPLFHLAKRDSMPIWKSWLIRICAVFIAILLSSLFIVAMTGQNPFSVFKSIIYGAFGDPAQSAKGAANVRWQLFQELAILLGVSIAVTPAFKMKFWNIGAEGQVLMGALVPAIISAYLGSKMSSSGFGKAMLVIVMISSGILSGIIWAVIPAVFKAKWNTNETLFTLMMNYVAISLINFFLKSWDPMHKQFSLVNGKFPTIVNNCFTIILTSLILTVFMFIYLKYTKHGYEIAVVGESKNTAKYIGLSVEKVTIRTLILSGAICGLMGAMLLGSVKFSVSDDIVSGYGFTAILVAWLAKFNPLFMILTAFIVVFFKKGSNKLVSDYKSFGITKDFGDIIVAIIFFFIIGCEFFLQYQIKLSKNKKKETKTNG